jgi:hypothetical protein
MFFPQNSFISTGKGRGGGGGGVTKFIVKNEKKKAKLTNFKIPKTPLMRPKF